jgi:hypothetical protein
MKVRELIEILRKMPDQEATVVTARVPDETFVVVSAARERGIRRTADNAGFAGPGEEPGVEIS